MASQQNQGTSFSPSDSTLCANGCGFFGTAANMNLCSKCYRDLRAEEEQAAKAKAVMEKSLNIETKDDIIVLEPIKPVEGSSSTTTAASVILAGGDEKPEPEPKKLSNRCFVCRKRVGLTGFKCRCQNTFCGEHRYAEKHDCSFDFKGTGRDAIANANPIIKADKLDRC